MVKLEAAIRDKAKQRAKELGMTLQGYIKNLIDSDVVNNGK